QSHGGARRVEVRPQFFHPLTADANSGAGERSLAASISPRFEMLNRQVGCCHTKRPDGTPLRKDGAGGAQRLQRTSRRRVMGDSRWLGAGMAGAVGLIGLLSLPVAAAAQTPAPKPLAPPCNMMSDLVNPLQLTPV